MNMQQWITPLLKMGNIKMYRKKSNGKGMIWASLFSLIISAVALFALKKGEKENQYPISTNIQKKENVDIQKFLSLNDRTVLAEFAKELDPKTNLTVGNKGNI
jgi:hypothetical protein